MSNPQSVSHTFSGTDKTISFETGRLAGLAGGAVLAQLGNSTVLVTATGAKSPRPGADFFPLTVDIEERMYAAGKIPGSFFRREGRAPESAILTCRLIDRPLRPMFPDGFRNEVHIVGTVMGADMENPHDVLALNGASAALMLSGIPFDGPVGAVRIAWSAAGEWVAHPTYEEGADSAFEMVVAGRLLDDGDVAVMMVEAGGTEATWEVYEAGAPKVDEAVLADGLEFSKQFVREVVELQMELVAAVGAPATMDYTVSADYSDEILAAVDAAG
jgi:polyribonucleotide nucleotidyltransferase